MWTTDPMTQNEVCSVVVSLLFFHTCTYLYFPPASPHGGSNSMHYSSNAFFSFIGDKWLMLVTLRAKWEAYKSNITEIGKKG